MTNFKKTALVLSLGFLGIMQGCSSSPTKEDIAVQEIKIQEIREEARQEAVDKQQERLEKEISDMPSWVINPPRADTTGFYGVGSGNGSDLLKSIRMSSLQAKFELASNLKSELSGEDTMIGSEAGEYRFIINSFVDKVELTGYEIVERQVKPIDGQYKTYVLIKMPYEKFNLILQNQAKPEQKATLEESYQRLMNKVSKNQDALNIAQSPAKEQ